MSDVFVKKFWPEENILFYLHFQDGNAIRQIEIMPTEKKFLSSSNAVQNGSKLCDQNIEELDIAETDFITIDEFEKIWKLKKE